MYSQSILPQRVDEVYTNRPLLQMMSVLLRTVQWTLLVKHIEIHEHKDENMILNEQDGGFFAYVQYSAYFLRKSCIKCI